MSHTSARIPREQTRERLLDAALELFAEKGVLAATVEEICERAGFTRGAFYSNFDSKDDLCIAAIQRYADEYGNTVRSALATVPSQLDPDTPLSDLLQGPLGAAFQQVVVAPPRVLAKVEILLYLRRTPQLADQAEQLGVTNHLFVAMFDTELKRLGLKTRLTTDKIIDMVMCTLESHTIRGTDPATIRQIMTDLLAVVIVRTDLPQS